MSPRSRRSCASGWVRDALHFDLQLEESRFTSVHWQGWDRKARCPPARRFARAWASTRALIARAQAFPANGLVAGTVTISPPPPKSIQHQGVTLTLKQALQAFDREGEVPVRETSWTLLEPGVISEPVTVPIEIDLASLAELLPSYAATHFELRHHLEIVAARPWWTFPVRRSEQLVIQASRAADAAAAPPVHLEVGDFGGLATFDCGAGAFATDGRIQGSVRLAGLSGSPPIAEVALVLGRTEAFGDPDVSSIRPQEADVEVRRWLLHTQPKAAHTEDTTLPVNIGIAAHAPGDAEKLLPSLPRTRAEKSGHLVGADHWLRLLLTAVDADGLKSWWASQPVTMLLPTGSAEGNV